MSVFLVMGVYRGLWRYTSVGDLIVFLKAVVLSSVGSLMVVLFAFRFEGFSRTAFAIDGVLMFMFLAGSRLAFRLFRQMLPVNGAHDGRRVLIYGAGDGGELLLRELRNNSEHHLSPIGFLDDDPAKSGKVIHVERALDHGRSANRFDRRSAFCFALIAYLRTRRFLCVLLQRTMCLLRSVVRSGRRKPARSKPDSDDCCPQVV